MKTSEELFPEQSEGYFYGGDYQPIIDSFGKVLLQVDDADYQGDTRVVLESEGKFGVLIFGWGSCSGCDALQACGSHSDINSLIESLHNDITWFDSLEELKAWSAARDWELQWAWHSSETKDFVEKIKEL